MMSLRVRTMALATAVFMPVAWLACDAGEPAGDGPCPVGLELCDGSCVDVLEDSNHCGSCVEACAGGLQCLDGGCSGACFGGERYCDGACVDVSSDPSHCGACGNACAASSVCSQGSCATDCTGGSTACDGVCVDTDFDDQHCGGCNMPCSGSTICAGGKCGAQTFASCAEILSAFPTSPSGEYNIDPDGSGSVGPQTVYCDMVTDGGGYTWKRIDSDTLTNDQDEYANACAVAGMEIIVTRTRAHAQALRDWNAGRRVNLLNIFPTSNGAQSINNWQGMCRGTPCSFWMTDDPGGNVSCGGFEPNGDNDVDHRIFRVGGGCGLQGNWNDQGNTVAIQSWVICSTNDK